MSVNPIDVGKIIAELRKAKGLTQIELGERLHVSYQAVSKWERGETLPDTAILADLANVLSTSADTLLNGGKKRMDYRGKIMVSDMAEGIGCLEKLGVLLGKENIIYRYAIGGINEHMNLDVEKCLADDFKREALIAEAVIQNLDAGAYVDLSDVKSSFKQDHFAQVVTEYAKKRGIL